MNFFKLNKHLLKALENKFIIFAAGYKGGIGKSILSLGIAKEFNIPYKQLPNEKMLKRM